MFFISGGVIAFFKHVVSSKCIDINDHCSRVMLSTCGYGQRLWSEWCLGKRFLGETNFSLCIKEQRISVNINILFNFCLSLYDFKKYI